VAASTSNFRDFEDESSGFPAGQKGFPTLWNPSSAPAGGDDVTLNSRRATPAPVGEGTTSGVSHGTVGTAPQQTLGLAPLWQRMILAALWPEGFVGQAETAVKVQPLHNVSHRTWGKYQQPVSSRPLRTYRNVGVLNCSFPLETYKIITSNVFFFSNILSCDISASMQRQLPTGIQVTIGLYTQELQMLQSTGCIWFNATNASFEHHYILLSAGAVGIGQLLAACYESICPYACT
jgi:hypothetical protein